MFLKDPIEFFTSKSVMVSVVGLMPIGGNFIFISKRLIKYMEACGVVSYSN